MRLLLFVLLAMLCSCAQEPTYFAPQLVEQLAHHAGEKYPPYTFIPLYVRTDRSDISRTTVDALYRVYRDGYTQYYASFPSFLAEALNQRLPVARRLLQRYHYLKGPPFFPLDSAAAAHYARLSPSARVATVCQLVSPQRWTLKPEVARAPGVETALYYLFLGNYNVGFDDYSGFYVITKGLIEPAK